tara:strand:- start:17187 stop:18032 length:846 start_codon:yes stop_codon:yes gene_type:complete
MSYFEVNFTIKPFTPFAEILVAMLAEIGFESFVEEESDSKLKAYIQETEFDELAIIQLLDHFSSECKLSFEITQIKKENWNQKWEESFSPVEVTDFCIIRAPFHEPKSGFKHELLIEPKMSFGTGHHQTTQMMVELMQGIDFENKSVLDMGSGTGILAILAAKLGATEIVAIDIEEWAYENMQENFKRNHCESINAFLGDASLIADKAEVYDSILANINKNTLQADLKHYDKALKPNGSILLSGFYEHDVADLFATDPLINYSLQNQLQKDHWVALHLQKG